MLLQPFPFAQTCGGMVQCNAVRREGSAMLSTEEANRNIRNPQNAIALFVLQIVMVVRFKKKTEAYCSLKV